MTENKATNEFVVSDNKESIVERVVELINEAIVATKETEKVNNLQQVQELVINHDILDNFLDEIIGFQNDKFAEVRKFVVGFIEVSCKKDAEFFPKLIVNLNFALNDQHANVVKRTIQTLTQLYKVFLKWISKTKITDVVQSTWEVFCSINQQICSLLDSTNNEGIRTQAIKFMEMLVIVQTKKDQWSMENDFNIESLASNKLVNIEQLEEEAKQVFEQLIIFHGTPHISSVNLMATMQTLVVIARQRSTLFMSKVIQALEALHANLPPTLTKSQVSSVRKHLKLQLLLLLKHPTAATNSQFQSQIIQLLNDLGAGQSEVHRCLQEVRKRGLKVEQAAVEAKRIKLESEDDIDEDDIVPPPKITRSDANTAIDITAEDLIPKLNIITNVSDLVLVSMLSLPDQMPAHFLASYTPIAAAGTPSQIKHLARLLSTQLTAAGLGKGVDEMVAKATSAAASAAKKPKSEEKQQQQQQNIATLISRGIAQEVKKQEQQHQLQLQQNKMKLMPTGKTLSGSLKFKQLNLAEITKELSEETKCEMILGSVSRILNKEEKKFFSLSQLESRIKILVHLSTEFHDFSPSISTLVKSHAFEDVKNRIDLLFTILYNEYMTAKRKNSDLSHYNNCLTEILKDLIQKAEIKDRDHFLPKLFLESPLVTDDAVELLRHFMVSDHLYPKAGTMGLNILKSLIEKKKGLRLKLLNLLLRLSIILDKPDIRAQAIRIIKYLHEIYGSDLMKPIETFTLDLLRKLLEPNPPTDIFQSSNTTWNEENIKICLLPYLSLLPTNHKLIHDLAEVYVTTSADIKRVILRVLDTPVKGMGMNSPELLLLVENCPKGAETLVTRVIHVLTDKQPPSAELVARVRDLYHKRVPDVRFLIPVLNGLTKKEVIAALSKLIKLNPVVVKEVFNRLLGTHVESGSMYQSPLTPAELLIALHNIDPSKCDMKTIIKATSLCFAEKNIYTAEVLAVVMQLLMDQNPLPTLLMRTVIQSLSLYPRLIGFVMNILQRLILKQVWKQKKVWEGFIKCCQKTKPQSFQVLLQLPAAQLQAVFAASPDFKPALQQHVQSFTDTQRSHIPQTILDVIFSDDIVPVEPQTDSSIVKDEFDSKSENENNEGHKIQEEN
ncbi:symplekin-like protein [Dinothrombium tinctorium]|uniref:Symplekin-like protein n=1 Tax=Dinothrombium tinctorium TaxID=1965070 RepID=A0A3S3SL97_9ACAR|nr:symplekin-like protein [Dinothrombium tinctorium]